MTDDRSEALRLVKQVLAERMFCDPPDWFSSCTLTMDDVVNLIRLARQSVPQGEPVAILEGVTDSKEYEITWLIPQHKVHAGMRLYASPPAQPEAPQQERLASTEWRRGLDEAIAFLYRHSNEEHFGEGFAEMLEEYAGKCVPPAQLDVVRCPDCNGPLDKDMCCPICGNPTAQPDDVRDALPRIPTKEMFDAAWDSPPRMAIAKLSADQYREILNHVWTAMLDVALQSQKRGEKE